MAQGTAKGVVRLYDEEGNPVEVALTNGRYELAVVDDANRRLLEEILVVLTKIQEALDQ